MMDVLLLRSPSEKAATLRTVYSSSLAEWYPVSTRTSIGMFFLRSVLLCRYALIPFSADAR